MTDTATALIEAAEGVFADSGFLDGSLRSVMRDAGTDPGAIHYHFGGREGLVAGVLDRVLVPINARRVELLDEIVASAVAPTVHDLVAALIIPDLEMAVGLEERELGRGRLVGAIYTRPADFVLERVEAHFGPVAGRFQPHLAAALPDVPPEHLAWRIRWILFGAVGALLLDGSEVRRDLADLLDQLIPPLAACLSASPKGVA